MFLTTAFRTEVETAVTTYDIAVGGRGAWATAHSASINFNKEVDGYIVLSILNRNH